VSKDFKIDRKIVVVEDLRREMLLVLRLDIINELGLLVNLVLIPKLVVLTVLNLLIVTVISLKKVDLVSLKRRRNVCGVIGQSSLLALEIAMAVSKLVLEHVYVTMGLL
jgi:hypothetical protein